MSSTLSAIKFKFELDLCSMFRKGAEVFDSNLMPEVSRFCEVSGVSKRRPKFKSTKEEVAAQKRPTDVGRISSNESVVIAYSTGPFKV